MLNSLKAEIGEITLASLPDSDTTKMGLKGSDVYKRQVGELVILGEGISFLMGCNKNYIMYWGVYVNYNSIRYQKSVHKVCRMKKSILCILTMVL